MKRLGLFYCCDNMIGLSKVICPSCSNHMVGNITENKIIAIKVGHETVRTCAKNICKYCYGMTNYSNGSKCGKENPKFNKYIDSDFITLIMCLKKKKLTVPPKEILQFIAAKCMKICWFSGKIHTTTHSNRIRIFKRKMSWRSRCPMEDLCDCYHRPPGRYPINVDYYVCKRSSSDELDFCKICTKFYGRKC